MSNNSNNNSKPNSNSTPTVKSVPPVNSTYGSTRTNIKTIPRTGK